MLIKCFRSREEEGRAVGPVRERADGGDAVVGIADVPELAARGPEPGRVEVRFLEEEEEGRRLLLGEARVEG